MLSQLWLVSLLYSYAAGKSSINGRFSGKIIYEPGISIATFDYQRVCLHELYTITPIGTVRLFYGINLPLPTNHHILLTFYNCPLSLREPPQLTLQTKNTQTKLKQSYVGIFFPPTNHHFHQPKTPNNNLYTLDTALFCHSASLFRT